MSLFDFIGIWVAGFGELDFLMVLGYFLAGGLAFVGAYFGILFIRFLTVRSGNMAFAYYNWGVAVFALILYLMV